MPPVDAGTSSTITVVARIGNAGATSGPSNASVLLESASSRTLLQSFPIPALERHEQFSHEFTWEVPAGLSRLALVIDSDGSLQESREDNNRATTWVNRDYGEPIDTAEPIRFETPGGSRAHPQGIATEWNNKAFTLRLHPQGNAPVQALVHQAWLDSRLGSSSLDGVAHEIVERDGEAFYTFEAPAGGPASFTFRSFTPVQDTERFTRGSIATLLLDERPMFVRLAAVPKAAPEEVARETPNGTIMARAIAPPPRLDLSFEDASHAGQGIWIHRDFLAGYGFANARFQHEDGTQVPAAAIGDYYHIEPAHFSIIQVFTFGPENFENVNAQPYSNVYGDGDAGFQRLVILSDRQDASDESLLRDFVPHQQYTLSAASGVVWQGNWQVAHPLAIGNRAERTSPAANTIPLANAMGFYYNARDCNLSQSPLIVAYYRGASGTETTVWSQTGPASVGCYSQLNWNFNLRLRVTATTTYFEFLNSAQTVLQSTGVVNTLLPTALDAITLGSEDRCNCGYEPTAELWTDDIRVDGIAGNFVNEDFGALSTGWTYTGNAVRNTDYVRLTPASANQVGTVRFNTPLTASRFSAEFSYRVGPDSSGADGMTFFFYKNTAYTPANGGSMGFMDASEPSNSGHEGYGFVLDGYQNSEYGELAAESIGIAKDHMDDSTRYLYYGTGIQKADGAWHTINIDVFETKIIVYQDGAYKFTYGGAIGRTYSSIGFSAGTGGLANYHDVDSVRISTPSGSPPPPPPTCSGPANNCFTSATAASSSSYTTTISTAGATLETGEQQPCGSIGATVWYAWTPSTSGQATASTVSGSTNYDTVLAAYTGSTLATLAAVSGATPSTGCSDDDGGNLQSLLSFPCTAGTTYRIQLGGYNAATGTAGLSLNCAAANQPPDTPSSPNPGSGTTNQPWSLSVSWTGGDPEGQLTTHTVYRRAGTGSYSQVCQIQTTGTSQFISSCPTWSGLSRNTVYQWYVVATDASGASTSGVASPWSFTTKANTAPPAPTLPNPVDGATNQLYALTLTWTTGTDIDGDTITRRVYTGTTSPPTTLRCGPSTTITSCAVSGLARGVTHYWKVELEDGFGGVSSSTWSFTTQANSAPPAPSNPSPSSAATNQLYALTLSWTTPIDSDGDTLTRRVYFGTNSPPTTLQCGPSTTMTTCAVSGLARGVTYNWKVELEDGFGGGSSSTWSFTTKPNSPPSTCLGLSNSYLAVTATNNCLDADGDSVTYTFNWGDGTPNTVVGPTTGYPSVPPHLYGINYCPSGTASVTLTASDGYGTVNDDETRSISDTRDDDNDGLYRCQEVSLQTLDTVRDTDGDGLGEGLSTNVPNRGTMIVGSDFIESSFYPNRNAVFCPTGALAANCLPNPRHKDIYIELDYMGTSGDHLPTNAKLQEFVNEFAAAPVTNPDGVSGVTMHIDAGSARAAAYNLGGGNTFTHTNFFGPPKDANGNCPNSLWTDFDTHKASSVGMASNRVALFHYGIIIHDFCTAGLSRGIFAKDFIMGMNADNGHTSDTQRLGMLSHEFGHNINLCHGGVCGEPNFKPNYFSSMNYRPTYDSNGAKVPKYSTRALGTLDENALNEARGLNPSGSSDSALANYLLSYKVTFDCPRGSPADDTGAAPYYVTPLADQSINWDCDASKKETNVVSNINGRTTRSSSGNVDEDGQDIDEDVGGSVADDCHFLQSASARECQIHAGHNDWTLMRFGAPSLTQQGFGQPGPGIHEDDSQIIPTAQCVMVMNSPVPYPNCTLV